MKSIPLLLSILWIFTLQAPVLAQESPEPPAATTTETAATVGDPKIPLASLELTLKPMTRDELAAEAVAWRDLVKNTLQEIAQTEIALRELNGAAADAAPEQAERKKTLLDRLTGLRDEKSARLDRLNAVLTAWETKGGDAKEYRDYAKAVAGLDVDVTDTHATWSTLQSWATSPEGGLKWIKRIGIFAAIMIAASLIGGILAGVVRKALSLRRNMSALLTRFLVKTTRRFVLFVGLIFGLSALGFNVGALVALIGGGAFVLGFALQDTLGNLASGVMLLIHRPFEVGDAVEVGGVSGKVETVDLVSTHILTFDNKLVIVPNKKVWGDIITNATSTSERRVDMTFGIGYSDDMAKAQSILERIVTGNEMVLKEPAPKIHVHELADSSVNFIVRPWVKTADYWDVYWNVTRRVKEEFDAAGVSIPFPQQDVHLHRSED